MPITEKSMLIITATDLANEFGLEPRHVRERLRRRYPEPPPRLKGLREDQSWAWKADDPKLVEVRDQLQNPPKRGRRKG